MKAQALRRQPYRIFFPLGLTAGLILSLALVSFALLRKFLGPV